MILVILTTVLVVCGGAKLDRSYVPPITAKIAGGSPGALLAPVDISSQVTGGLPSGSYTNDAQGIVVDAAAPGTRTSGAEPTGLGGPRTSYGSTDSKVGDAAFTGFGSFSGPSTRIAPGFGSITGAGENTGGPSIRIAPGFESTVASEGSDYDKTRAGTVKFSNEIGLENYSYGFETDNGITKAENGVASDGVKAQGGYSYKGDDGKVYSVSYTADKDGYKPHGSHLPTPHPIPEEILISLEQNAKDEAAGIIDDGTYDAQKYNDDYPSNNGDGDKSGSSISGADAVASGSFLSHGIQAGKPHSGAHGVGSYQAGSVQGPQGFGTPGIAGHISGNIVNSFSVKDKSAPQGITQHSLSTGAQGEQTVLLNAGQSGQGSALLTHTTQNRFGLQPGKSSATATASLGNGLNNQGLVSPNPTLHSQPGSLDGNTAYSSAVTTGSGSASAYASSGSLSPGVRNENIFGSTGQFAQSSKYGFNYSNRDPATATASASIQGQGATGQAGLTNYPSAGISNSNKVLTPSHSTLGSTIYSQNTNTNGFESSDNLPPVNIVESTGQVPHSSNLQGAPLPSYYGPYAAYAPSIVNTQPLSLPGSITPSSTSSIESSSDGLQQINNEYKPPHNAFGHSAKPPNYQSNLQSITSGTLLSATPTKLPATELTTPFESIQSQDAAQLSNAASNSFGGTNNVQFSVPASTQISFLPPSQQALHTQSSSTFQSQSGHYKPQVTQTSSTLTGSNGASSTSNSPKPALTQQQGSDSSYFYNQPAKPFVTEFSNNGQPNAPATSSQQGPKYSNTPIVGSVAPTASFQPGQNHGSTTSTNYNGITQASISSFPSAAPTSSIQFGSQSSQFGSKPISHIGELSSSQTQFGATGNQQNFPEKPVTQITQKPIVQSQSQFGQQSSSHIAQNPSQQGTIYEYNKPTSYKETTSTSGQVTSSIDSQTKPSQNSYEFHQQSKPLSSGSQSPVQQSQIQASTFGSQSTSYGTESFSSFHSQSGQTQLGQKPSGNSQTGSSFQPTQSGSSIGSQFSKNPTTQSESTIKQTQFGSSGSQFGLKPTSSQIGSSQTHEQQTQGTLYEYNKPTSNVPSDKEAISVSLESQSSEGSSSTSSTQGQGTQAGNKPFSSVKPSTTFQQQTQTDQSSTFGSQPITQFGQKPYANQGTSGFGNSQTGSKFGSSSELQLGQKPVSQYGEKPFGSQPTQGTLQGTHFGSSTGSEFGQKPQLTQGSSFASSVASQSQTSQFEHKPNSDSVKQQTQFGSTFPSPFSQKPSQGSGSISSTFSQTGSTPLQTQFGSTSDSKFGQKPQSAQGTSVTSSTVSNGQLAQTTHFGQKPLSSSSSSGSSFSQTQFGGSTTQGSEEGQDSADQTQSSYSQKPGTTTQVGTNIQQTAFGTSSGSQYGQKPQSSFTSGVPSKGQATQIGSSQTTGQFGSSTGQTPQTTQGTGLTSSTISQSTTSNAQKPFESSQQTVFGSYTGSQFAQKPQTNQGSSYTSGSISKGQSIHTTQFGLKPADSSADNKFGQKPLSSSSSSGSSFSQTQFGGSATQGSEEGQDSTDQTQSSYSQKPGTTTQVGTNIQQTAFGTSSGSQYGQKPQSSFTTGVPFKGQAAQIGSSQTTGQFGSSTGQTPQTTQGTGLTSSTISQTTTSNAQKPFESSQQTVFGSYTGSQFAQKPQANQGSSYTSGSVSKGQSIQTTQFGLKPADSSADNKFGQKPLSSSSSSGSSFSQTQFGGSTTQGSEEGQDSADQTQSSYSQKPGTTTQLGTNIQQTAFGTSSGSQYGQKPQSSFTSGVPSKGQATQIGSSQTTGQFGSSTGQTPQTTQGTGLTSSTISQTTTSNAQKPFESSQQTVFGSYTGSQFSQKPQANQGSSYTSGSVSKGQSIQTTQFGLKPADSSADNKFGQKPLSSSSSSGSSFSQTQFGGSTTQGSEEGQDSADQTQSSYSQKPGTTTQVGTNIQQTAFGTSSGSQYGQKPQSSFTSGVPSKGQATQIGSSQTTGQFGSSTGQTPQTTQGTGLTSSTISQTTTSNAQKPFESSQQTVFGSYTGSQFAQKPQANQGSSYTSGSVSKGQSLQTTQFGLKPADSSADNHKPQTTGTFSTITSFGEKPTDSAYQQTLSGSSSSSHSGQKPQSALGYTFTSSAASKEQTKPISSTLTTGSSLLQTQFSGTTGSQLAQKPQSSVGTISAITPQVQTNSQYNNKPFGSQSIQGASQQNQLGSSTGSQSGLNIGSNTGSGSLQAHFGGSTGSVFGQKQQSGVGTISAITPQVHSISQYGKIPLGSQSTQGAFQKNQLGLSTVSQSGLNIDSQSQSIQTTQKPVALSLNTGSGFLQTHFGGSTGSVFDKKQQSGVGTISAITPQVHSISQYGKIPLGSQSTQGASQQNQHGSSTGSQSGLNIGSNTGSGSLQAHFGGSTGSVFGQKQQSGVGTISAITPQVQSLSQYGKKPSDSQSTHGAFQQNQLGLSTGSQSGLNIGSHTGSGSLQAHFGSSTGSVFDKKHQSGVGTISAITPQVHSISQYGKIPLGSQSTQGASQQNQHGSSTGSQSGLNIGSNTGSGSLQAHFGGSTGSVFDKKQQSGVGTISAITPQVQSISQYGKIPLGSQSIQGASQQNQLGSSTGTQSGLNTGSSTGSGSLQAHFGGSTGSVFDKKQQSGFGTISAITPQVQTVSQYGNKPSGSQSTQGASQQNQLGLSTGSQSGLNIGSNTGSGSLQAHFGGSTGSVFDKKQQSGVGTISAITPQVQSISQYGKIPLGSQSNQGAFHQNQLGLSTGSQSGLNIGSNTGSGSLQAHFGGSTGSVFDKKQQSGVGTISAITPQVQSLSQNGKIPFGSQSTQGAFQQNQLGLLTGSQSGLNIGSNTGSGSLQAHFGGSSGSVFDKKQQSGVGTISAITPQVHSISQYGKIPLGSQSTQGASQQNQHGSFTGSQSGLNIGSNTGSGSLQAHFGGSTGSVFDKKQQSGVGSISAITPQVQSISQYGKIPLGSQSTQGAFHQNQLGLSTGSQSGLNIGSNTGSGSLQAHFGGSTGSVFDKKQQSGVGTISAITPQVQSLSQNGKIPFGSQSTQGAFQQNQLGLSTGSQSGLNIDSQSQSIQTTQKPVALSLNTGSGFLQTHFGGSTGSVFGQKQQSGVGTISAITPQVQSISQYGKIPLGSQSIQGASQQNQLGSSTGSQSGLNTGSSTGSGSLQAHFGGSTGSVLGQKQQSGVGTISAITPHVQFGQKPISSSQNTNSHIQKTQSGVSLGSLFSQTPSALGTQASSSAFTQSAQTQLGTQAKKPFSHTQKPAQPLFGLSFGQKPKNSASAFASSSVSFGGTQTGHVSKDQTNTFGTQSQKPIGSSSTQTLQQNAQGSSPFGSSQSTVQQPHLTGGLKPFGSLGTTYQQTVDQKTQSTQSGIHSTATVGGSAQSTSTSSGSVQHAGYNYPKPQKIFNSASRFGGKLKPEDQNTQSGQTSFTSLGSSLQFNTESSKPFNFFGFGR